MGFFYRLREFMRYRNGMDALNRIIILVALILSIIAIFTRLFIFNYLSILGFIWFIFRLLSRNITARQHENEFILRIRKLFNAWRKYKKEYRVFLCSGCGRILRVPKGKGKVELSCPVCGRKKIRRA